jgi:peroxiredoxin/outer membrane lipoprotein-sorting protein
MYRLLLCMLSSLLLAQRDARELIQQSSEAIKRYKSYELDSLVVVETHGGALDGRLEMPASVSVRRPDKMRIESRNQSVGLTVVSDGDYTWIHMTPLNKYVKREAVGSPEAALGSGMLGENFPDLTKSVKAMSVIGEETIEVSGKKIPCWIVETRYEEIRLPGQDQAVRDAVQITWIAKAEGLTLRSAVGAKLIVPNLPEPVEIRQTMRTTRLLLDVDLPDSRFVFTPPPDASETADWTLPGIVKPEVVGKPAPEFTAQAMDGTKVDLAALHGKVVLLDFWTAWCVPCRKDLPAIEKLHREFREEGLAVLGISVGGDKAAARKFVGGTAPTFPILPLDEAGDLLSKLSVNAFPTLVLIDREGKVAVYEVGVQGEAALRADLAKLGIAAR